MFRTERAWGRWYRRRTLEILGNKCVRCGISDERVLEIDHVNGDGYKEKTRSTHGLMMSVMKDIQDGTGRFQLLCANCHKIKTVENKEFNAYRNKKVLR